MAEHMSEKKNVVEGSKKFLKGLTITAGIVGAAFGLLHFLVPGGAAALIASWKLGGLVKGIFSAIPGLAKGIGHDLVDAPGALKAGWDPTYKPPLPS